MELVIGPSPCRGVLVVNGEFERYIDSGVRARVELDQERLTRGNNEISFMPMADDVPSEDDAWRLTEELSAVTVLREIANDVTGKGEWAFAKWEPPGPAQFVGATKSSMGDRTTPTWWRASFTVSDDAYRGPIAADLTGMTKGQVYLNGKHVGRYFQATADGTELASARPVALPEAWMSPAGAANTLMIFDEHGGNPGKIKLAVPGMVVRAEP